MKRKPGRKPKSYFYFVKCKGGHRLKPGITDKDDLKERRLGRDIGCECDDYVVLLQAEGREVALIGQADDFFSNLGDSPTPDDLEAYIKAEYRAFQVFDGREVLRPELPVYLLLEKLNNAFRKIRIFLRNDDHRKTTEWIDKEFATSAEAILSSKNSVIPVPKARPKQAYLFQLVEGGKQ